MLDTQNQPEHRQHRYRLFLFRLLSNCRSVRS